MMWVALVVVAALTGSLTALLTDAMRRADAKIEAEIQQRHRAGGHVRYGGRGPCQVCGHKELS